MKYSQEAYKQVFRPITITVETRSELLELHNALIDYAKYEGSRNMYHLYEFLREKILEGGTDL